LLVAWPAAGRVTAARPVVWMGERSYSLYLVHLPLIGVLAALFAVHGASVGFVVLCVAASLALSVVFHRYVERPSTRLSSLLRRRTPLDHEARSDEPTGGPTPESEPRPMVGVR